MSALKKFDEDHGFFLSSAITFNLLIRHSDSGRRDGLFVGIRVSEEKEKVRPCLIRPGGYDLPKKPGIHTPEAFPNGGPRKRLL